MRDLRAIATWFSYEGRAIAGFVREPEIWIALAGGLILWALAYQAPFVYQIDVGGSRQTMRQWDDQPFLVGFNDPEPDGLDTHPDVTPYRWTRDESTIRLPGVGGGRWLATILAGSGRSTGESVTSRWDDGATTTAVTVEALPKVYRLVADADGGGDLTLRLVAPQLQAPNDPRTLGLMMFRVSVAPLGGVQVPATRQLALLAAALALVYLLLRRLVCAPRAALAAALGLAALAAALLAGPRMALTLITPRLPAILIGCYALGLALDALYRYVIADCRLQIADWHPRTVAHPSSFVAAPSPPVARRSSFGVLHPPLVVGLIVLALALRVVGVVHPHMRSSDDGLNTNNLIGFTRGEVYFTEALPSEAGGGPAPYPPGQYIVFAPALLLLPRDFSSLRMMLRVGNALWDSLVVGVLWYALRRGGYGPRAALLGAALYILPAPLLRSLSIGEFANVFGQALALPPLVLLAVRARTLQRPPFPAILAGLLALALLGHLGVTISLVCLLGCLVLVWLIRLETRRAVRVLAIAGLIAGALVALLYYTAFGDLLSARLAAPAPAGGAPLSVAEKLGNQIGALPAYGLSPLALALGALGAVLVALRARPRLGNGSRPALGALLIAWWGGTLLSVGLLLFAGQGVRWQQFLYPALCLGVGPALAGLWPRGRPGRLVAAALLGFLLWYGLSYWVAQIVNYKHV